MKKVENPAAADVKDTAELGRQWKPQAPEHGNRVTAQKTKGRGLRPGLSSILLLVRRAGNTKLILNGNYSIDEHISNNGRSDRAPMVIGEFDATDA